MPCIGWTASFCLGIPWCTCWWWSKSSGGRSMSSQWHSYSQGDSNITRIRTPAKNLAVWFAINDQAIFEVWRYGIQIKWQNIFLWRYSVLSPSYQRQMACTGLGDSDTIILSANPWNMDCKMVSAKINLKFSGGFCTSIFSGGILKADVPSCNDLSYLLRGSVNMTRFFF